MTGNTALRWRRTKTSDPPCLRRTQCAVVPRTAALSLQTAFSRLLDLPAFESLPRAADRGLRVSERSQARLQSERMGSTGWSQARLLMMKKKTSTRNARPTADSSNLCGFHKPPPDACVSLGVTAHAETPPSGAAATAGVAVPTGCDPAVTEAYMLGFASVAIARAAESTAGAACGPGAEICALAYKPRNARARSARIALSLMSETRGPRLASLFTLRADGWNGSDLFRERQFYWVGSGQSAPVFTAVCDRRSAGRGPAALSLPSGPALAADTMSARPPKREFPCPARPRPAGKRERWCKS